MYRKLGISLSWDRGLQIQAFPAQLPVIDDWHSSSNCVQMLKVYLSSSYACGMGILKLPYNFAPWVNDDRVTIAFPFFIVPASLSCCNDIALSLHCPSPQ